MDESADTVIQYSRTPYEPYASKAMDRGRLLSVEDYNANGTKVKSKTLSYEKDKNTFVRAMTGIWRNVCPNSAVSYDEGSAYKIYTYIWLQNKETETYYNSSNGNEMQKTETIYIEKITYLDDGKVIDGEYRKYNEVHHNLFLLERIDLLKKDNSLLYHNLLNSVDDYTIPILTLAHNSWSILFTPTIYSSFVIEHSEKIQIKAAGSTILNQTGSCFISLINNQTGGTIFSYTYKPLVGITSMTNPQGLTTRYEYDVFSRLKCIKDHAGKVIESYNYHYRNQ